MKSHTKCKKEKKRKMCIKSAKKTRACTNCKSAH